jgi:hypothetical protein
VLVAIAIGRQKLIGAADDDGHLHVVIAADSVEISEVSTVFADEADGPEGLMGEAPHGRGHPLREPLATAFNGESVAEVVGKHDVEAREELVLDVALDVDEPSVDRQAIMDITVENELPGGTALESDVEVGGPFGGALRSGHFGEPPCAKYCDAQPINATPAARVG